MGFNIRKVFPSRFVSGDEIAGKDVPALVIKDVKQEKARSPLTQKEEHVLVVYFEGTERGVRLGKERAYEIASALGSENTDDWKGKTIKMFTEKKNAFGKEMNVIHFAPPKP